MEFLEPRIFFFNLAIEATTTYRTRYIFAFFFRVKWGGGGGGGVERLFAED